MQKAEHEEITEWASQCLYECKICNAFSCKRNHDFQRHLSSAHDGITPFSYQQGYGSSITVLKHHDCKFCGAQVNHDMASISIHVGYHHNTKISDYYDMHINTTDQR